MKFLGYDISLSFRRSPTPSRRYHQPAAIGNYRNIASYDYNGEKNLGEAGPIIDYRLNFTELRIRSHQAMLESDTAQIGIKRLVAWTIGKGLKPQSEPVIEILESEGITLDKKKFGRYVESAFNLYRRSRHADFSGMKTLDEISQDAETNAMVGGDVLVILRVIDNCVKVQIIDGQHIQSPEFGSEDFPKELESGNRIIDGVELDSKGRHVAFYVRTSAVSGGKIIDNFKFERIEAYGKKSGILMAYLYYGSKHRLNNVRGIPLISSVIEKLKKIEGYTDATLTQAKEAARVSYQVVHDKDAEGKNPMLDNLVKAYNVDGAKDLPTTDDGTQLAKNLQVTLGNSSFNNPPGAKIETLENKNPLYFKDFFETNTDAVFAVLSIPPNVATSKYNDSFSASRAAIKDWEHTLEVKRHHHHFGFLKPIWDLWLELEIINNRVSAPKYLSARLSYDYRVIEAYQNVRFIGAQVPHIDPVKEVEAARRRLGELGKTLPIGDLETITEMLGGGDSAQNLIQFADELKSAESLGIKAQPPAKKPSANS